MKCEVFYVEKYDNNGPVFSVVDEFTASSHEDANQYIIKYNEIRSDEKRTYYYRPNDNYRVIHSDGTSSRIESLGHYCDSDSLMRAMTSGLKKKWRSIRNDKSNSDVKSIVKRIALIRKFMNIWIVKKSISAWIWLKDNVEWYCWDKWVCLIHDWKSEHRRVNYFKKYHHDMHEPWSLDSHILGDLKWNLIRLKKESHGIPTQFIEEVVTEQHKDEPNWSYDEWVRKHSPDSEIEKLAIQKMNDVYDKIIHLIDLYGFYSMNEVDDENYPDQRDPAEPIILPGTYDILDYQKMYEKSREFWDEIWDLVKKYGMSMWD